MNKSSRLVVLVILAVLVAGVLAAGWCFWPRPNVDKGNGNGTAGPTVQGITPAELKEFYHLPEGSELYPLAWIKAMHDKDTKKPFLEDIERFGMLPDSNDKDGLPIGVSKGKSRGLEFLGPMIGVNCAACHVGQLTYKGKSLTLIGGPSMISMDRFYGDLFGSVDFMVKNPDELVAFYGRLSKEKDTPIDEHTRVLLTLVTNLAKAAPDLQQHANSVTSRFHSLLKEVHEAEHADIETIKPFSDDDRTRLRARLSKLYEEKIKQLLGSLDLPDLVLPDPLKLRGGIEELVTNAALMKGRLRFLQKIKKLHDTAGTTPGPGRSDAFGIISNMVMRNANIKLTAPVSYPYIWSLGPPYETKWFHYDGNTTSLLQRNVGQAIGLGAAFDDDDTTFSSTIIIRDMDKLQQITRKIRPPEWPEQLFGAINKDKFKDGAKLFRTHCLRCHADAFEKDSNKREYYYDYKEVGTDPNRIDNFQIQVGGVPYIKALKGAAEKLTSAAYKDSKVTPDEQMKMEPAAVKWESHKAYMARPLVAIWATAPYLHNGSVPTIYDLLQPAAKRPKCFTVGNREYDPKKLGYSYTEPADCKTVGAPQWLFDSTVDGNHNTGHEYGKELDDDQKSALIEYLKGNYVTKSP